MIEKEQPEDLLTVLKMAIGRGGFIEFYKDRHHHVAPLEEMFVIGDEITITHPEVSVNYGDGKYVEMWENHPTFHRFNRNQASVSLVEDLFFENRHYLVDTPERPFHIFINSLAPEAA